MRELLARVEAVIRRAPERQPVQDVISLPSCDVDLAQCEIRHADGDRVELSERERDLLRYFTQNRARIISRDELLQRVWRISPTQTETRTVDMHVANLRAKLNDSAESPKLIVTIRGKGYRFDGGGPDLQSSKFKVQS